jgi:hypothetical protein
MEHLKTGVLTLIIGAVPGEDMYNSNYMRFYGGSAYIHSDGGYTFGFSVRCIEENTGTVSVLHCNEAVTYNILVYGYFNQGVSVSVPYAGGNGGTHGGLEVTSTSVSGLVANLVPGSFVNGSGSLVFDISGTPESAGNANFQLNVGGDTCTLSLTVADASIDTLYCGGSIISGELRTGHYAMMAFEVPYAGGNGGFNSGQSVNSTGSTGLTAYL